MAQIYLDNFGSKMLYDRFLELPFEDDLLIHDLVNLSNMILNKMFLFENITDDVLTIDCCDINLNTVTDIINCNPIVNLWFNEYGILVLEF